jgi:uncharacterized protein (DUF2249 family)
MSSPTVAARHVDIRTLEGCVNRKACVLESFDALAEGESVEVINDHLPRGLLLHFEELRPGRFDWTALENGPETFRVRITKRAPA